MRRAEEESDARTSGVEFLTNDGERLFVTQMNDSVFSWFRRIVVVFPKSAILVFNVAERRVGEFEREEAFCGKTFVFGTEDGDDGSLCRTRNDFEETPCKRLGEEVSHVAVCEQPPDEFQRRTVAAAQVWRQIVDSVDLI